MREGKNGVNGNVTAVVVVVEGVGAFVVEADIAHQIALGVDGQCVVAEEVYLHLVVPVGLLFVVLLDVS